MPNLMTHIGRDFNDEPFLKWLRDLPARIEAQRDDLRARASLIHEALIPSGYSREYCWYRLREALGLLTKDE